MLQRNRRNNTHQARRRRRGGQSDVARPNDSQRNRHCDQRIHCDRHIEYNTPQYNVCTKMSCTCIEARILGNISGKIFITYFYHKIFVLYITQLGD